LRTGRINFNPQILPNHYQPREADLRELRSKLGAEQSAIGIIGLRGMGGIGKTVLAIALAHDPAITSLFPDGVVWLTFGRDAAGLRKAEDLAAAVTGKITHFESMDTARGLLGDMTRDVAVLIILDDVWAPEATDPFTALGPKCRVVITTRDSRVLTRANANRHDVGLLAPRDARDFLATAAGLANADTLPHEAGVIIGHCGRLPLALAAVGALIRRKVYDWTDALQALNERATEEFDTSWLSDPEQRNVALVLGLSVDSLPPDVKACFLACAAFREDADIPEATLLRLWSGVVPNPRLSRRIAEELEGRSLITRDKQGRYHIHDLYVDLLHRLAAPLTARHANLVARYRSDCPSGWDACSDDGYILWHLPWHLQQSGQTQELCHLLFDFSWLWHTAKSDRHQCDNRGLCASFT
jgi:hypothetical protein